MQQLGKARGLVAIGAIAIIVGACSGGGAATAAPASAPATTAPETTAPETTAPETTAPESAAPATGEWKIGYSNAGGVGNGFREEQVCTAQGRGARLRPGRPAPHHHPPRHRRGRPAPATPHLIAAGRRRDRLQPERSRRAEPGARRGQCGRHHDRLGRRLRHQPGHLQPLQQPDQVRRARRQLAVRAAGWRGHRLLHARHRRPPGRLRPRHRLQERPRRVSRASRSSRTRTACTPAGTRPRRRSSINNFIAAGDYDNIDGIWTSGMDSQVVDAIKAAGKEYVPIVGADLGAFVTQLLDPTDYPGLDGRRGDQHRRRRRRGRQPGAQAAQRRDDRHRSVGRPAQHRPARPGRRRQRDRRGQGDAGVAGRWYGLDPLWPLGLQIDGWTTYTPEQAVACKGPGE